MTGRTLLFVHQNFPGQIGHIAAAAAARGDRVFALGGRSAKPCPGVELRRWTNARSSTPGVLDAAVRAEADLIRAEAAALAAERMRDENIRPDVVIGHPGWGETLHLREIFPDARLILYGEYFYNSPAAQLGFDPETGPHDLRAAMRANAKNATGALAYALADVIVCPTAFQASTFPAVFQPRIRVHHEGVDLERARPRPEAVVRLPGGGEVRAGDPVITFLNRQLEPMRGFHVFMRALPEVLAACPDAQVLLIGDDGPPAYGVAAGPGRTWKRRMLDELGARLDLDRVHFMGAVPHELMVGAFSITRAHVYLTYPFVLSWSLIEAMGCEALVVASDTGPVRDVVSHGENGLLQPFLDVAGLSRTLMEVLREPERFAPLKAAARASVLARFDRSRVGVPGWLQLIDEVHPDQA